jgi:plastocyanin
VRRLALGAALLSLALATACGGAEDDAADAPESARSALAEATAGAGSGSGDSQTLTGTVGTAEDPDAFVITLTDGSGKEVTSLPAGNYSIQVKDPSKVHNFHLKGKGVDESTSVPEVTDTTFDVELRAGTYTFVCDPHPRMVGEVEVT